MRDENVYRMFDLDWDIEKNERNVIVEEIRRRKKSVIKERELIRERTIMEGKIGEEGIGKQGEFSKKKAPEEGKTVVVVK